MSISLPDPTKRPLWLQAWSMLDILEIEYYKNENWLEKYSDYSMPGKKEGKAILESVIEQLEWLAFSGNLDTLKSHKVRD